MLKFLLTLFLPSPEKIKIEFQSNLPHKEIRKAVLHKTFRVIEINSLGNRYEIIFEPTTQK